MPDRLPTETAQAMAAFGERLRDLRQAYEERDGPRGHTRSQWAKRLRVSPAMYGRWEAGKFLPRIEDLLRICQLFRVDPNYLVAGILSAQLRPWLVRALREANPRIEFEADWWKRRSEAFLQADQELADAARTNALPEPPRSSPRKRKTPHRPK
jgi:transcriptional regulator with XRE-family HTH domain